MSRSVHVTHVVFDLHGGGLESLVAAMARRFRGTEIRMSVITLSGRAGRVGDAVRPLLDQFHTCRPVRGLSMLAPVGVARRIATTAADVVHLHSGAWFKGAWAARLAGVPKVIYTEHGREHDDPWLARWLDRRAASLTSQVVAVSDRLRTYLATRIGIPDTALVTIENGVDVERYAPGRPAPAVRAQLGIPPSARVVGSMGRLERVKNYAALLEAFAAARARSAAAGPLYLVICGEGSERDALAAQAQRLGIADAIRLPGWVDDPVEFYRLFDVFALTSVSEGSPLSLMEAMACGAVPLVTDVGANAEILGPALARQVVAPADTAAFGRAVSASLESPAELRAFAALARERIVREYNLDTLVAAYARLYLS